MAAMAQETQHVITLQMLLFKSTGKKKEPLPQAEIQEVYKKINSLHDKFEKHLKKNLGIKSISIKEGIIECHAEDDWDLERIQNSCKCGEAIQYIRNFLEANKLLAFHEKLSVDFKWSTAKKKFGSNVAATVVWFENQVVANEHSETALRMLCSDMSHGNPLGKDQNKEANNCSCSSNNQTPVDSGDHEKPSISTTPQKFDATFLLFLPKQLEEIEKVWLVMDDANIQMNRADDKQRLWVANAKVEIGREYFYKVKHTVSSYLGFKKHSYEDDDGKRKVIEHHIQRDIFGNCFERSAVTAGYKVFLEMMLKDMESEDNLHHAIEDFEIKHGQAIDVCDSHDLASHILKVFSSCKPIADTRSLKAIFAVYFLAKIYPKADSVLYYPFQIEPEILEVLLHSLKMAMFKPLRIKIQEMLADMLVALLIRHLGRPNCTWLHFLFYFGYFLSSGCLLKRKHSFWNNSWSQEDWNSVMQMILNLVDDKETFDSLIVELLKVNKSMIAHLKVFKSLQTRLPAGSHLLIHVRNQICILIKESLKNDISQRFVANIREADQTILLDLREEFEETILNQLNRNTLDCHELLGLVSNDVFFCDKDQAFKLMSKAAQSQKLHSFFLEIAKGQKFLQILNSDSVQSLVLLEAWLELAKKQKSEFGFDRDWYDFVSQALAVAGRLQDDQIKYKIEKLITDYFSSSAINFVSNQRSVQDIMNLSMFLRPKGPMEEQILHAICPTLESSLLKLVQLNFAWSKKEYVAMLLQFLGSPLLFNEPNAVVNILETLAVSHSSCVHRALLEAMSDKFWNILQLKQLDLIFRKWILTARNHHCKEKVKFSKNYSSREVESVLFLYEYLADFSEMVIPSDYIDLKNEIEVFVREEFENLGPDARMDLITAAESQKKSVSTLLERHFSETKSGTLSEAYIKSQLKSFEDKEIDIKLRMKFTKFKVFLQNMNDHMQSLSDVDKQEFVLTYSAFCCKVISYKGVQADELKAHDAVYHMMCTITSFSASIMNSTITVKDFKHFENMKKNAETLIFHVLGEEKFCSHWDNLKSEHDKAHNKFLKLKALYISFLQRMKSHISDLTSVQQSLKHVEENLDPNSSCPIGDLNKQGFFQSLGDLVDAAENLYPLREFRTFVNLCKRSVAENVAALADSLCSLEESDLSEANLSMIFEEGTESSEQSDVLALHVANYLQIECIMQYRNWIKEVTSEEATLASALQYCTHKISLSAEVEKACKHFSIPVADCTLETLDWLTCLDVHSQNAKNIQKTLLVFDVHKTLSELDTAIDCFLECLTVKNDVTVEDLANIMTQLKDLLSEKENGWWALMEELCKASELVLFIKQTLDDDFRNLIDAVEEQSEQTIDESTVSDLIRVKQFLQPLLRQKFEEPKDFFDSIKKSMQKEGQDISSKISNCCHHHHGLVALYQHVANRGELTKEIIGNALTIGKYVWSLQKEESNCTVLLTYTKQKSDFSYGLEELNDFRSRALLLSNSEKREKGTEGLKGKQLKADLQCFVNAVDMIQEITSNVTELHRLGHFSFRTYLHQIRSDKMLFLGNLSSFLESLRHNLDDWKSVLDSYRRTYHSLNFIYSDQLSLVYNFLSGSCDKHEIMNVLNFVHPGLTVEALKKYQQIGSSKEMSGEQKLALIGSALDKLIQHTAVKHISFPKNEKFFKQSSDVKAIVEPGNLYIAHLETKSTRTIPTLLSLYANTKGRFPVPTEVLFCHELTSWEEVQLLINRSVRSQPGAEELHCICNVERLPSQLQTRLVEELGQLLETGETRYRLAVICRGAEHHSITDYFSSHVHRGLSGFDTATLLTCLQTTWPDVSVVTSSVPGLGKTEFIRNLASEKGKRIKTVHISGPVSREILVAHLQSQKLAACDLLHLDIGEVDDPNFLDGCLFEYIVLGCLCSGTKVVCLPTSFIAIEVANTVQDKLRDSLVVLSSFNRKDLKWQEYAQFVVSTELCSPVQIVCNYLKCYDEGTLDSRDIILTGPLSAKPLEPVICKSLLRKHFCSAADLSYSVMEIFLNVLGDQLRKLSNSQFFRVSNLRAMLGDKKHDVRSKLVKALLDVAQEFACRSVNACRSVQTAALVGADTAQRVDVSKLTQAELMVKRVDGMLHWADSNHLLVTFNGIDCQTVSALYRDLQCVPDYIKELFKSQLRKELPNFSNLSRQELQSILERVARSSLQKDKSKDVDATYALAPDNILKMVLILLRIKANIPVVIMGETGCGKTSLIRYLASVCDTKFEHFSIHAGITVEMITEVVLKNHNQCIKYSDSKIWLFLDEINTCDHLGLLTEIVCHHSCFGKTLSKNLIIIAACNPYRLREEHQIMTTGLDGKVKTDSFSRLVYRVHPLPETMIDYIWDYGTLHKDDEKSYIKQMVSTIYPKSNPSWNLREKIGYLLVFSQDFIRNSEKCDWCVSLRDVYRCQMLMTEFLRMLIEKSQHVLDESHPPLYYKKDDATIFHCSIVLALAHCYQSRLATTSKREQYWRGCSKILLGSSEEFRRLTEMVRYEHLDLLNRMQLPHGIAKNTALCENVFVILICILNRIPIFLVGKPGCSKSLSVQLIKSNLRGKDSVDTYFQTLPNLYIVSYQGSESSTSEGILKVFNKAKKYGEVNKEHGVLPVVLLDEVGLAEASRFNPLKVLHGLLEPATGELPSVAVVGISNWALDAAKMNRAIYLSRPDMDERELFETGKSISAVHSSDITGNSIKLFKSTGALSMHVNEETLKVLAKAYFKYQQEQLVKNFHGLRDYYALIKYVSRLVNEQEAGSSDLDMDEVQIVMRGLQRNFGGTEYGVSGIVTLVGSSLAANPSQKWPVQEIIMDNLKDKLARHLMLITSGNSFMGILLNCLNSLERKYVIIFGSKFEEDQTEDYSYRILSRIILCMEAGSILILKDLDTIYGSLYDMLNQNYTVVGKKKNCRIALGPYSNPMCQVHDDFRCIVLVDEQKVNYSDPPFLNRFEKQILRFEDIIADEQRKVIKELENWMDDFCKMPNLPFVKDDAFIGLNPDTISSIVYQTTQRPDTNKTKIFVDCQNALLWLVPPDAILRATHSEFADKATKDMRTFQSKYFERPIHRGLCDFLAAVLEGGEEDLPPVFTKTNCLRIVIYTHSNIYVDLRRILKRHEPLQIEKLDSFKSEKQLTKQLRGFFESDNKLLILQCKPHVDGKHIPLAKFQLEELHQEYANKSEKHICIVLHMERTTSPASSVLGQFSFLSGWQLAVIESLEEQESLPLTEALCLSISDILQTEFCPIKQCIQTNLVWAFTCTSSSYGERSIHEFSELVRQISESEPMLSCLIEWILECTCNSEGKMDTLEMCDPDRWQVKVACDMRLLHSATSFTDALKLYLTNCVTTPLANLVYHLERLSAWHSFFIEKESACDMWKRMFNNREIFSVDSIEIPQGPGSFKISHKPLKLQCPFSQIFIENLCKREELFKQDLLEAETTSSGSEGLSTCEYLGLFEKYHSLFKGDIALLMDYEILPLFEEEFISDVCNYLSLGYVLNDDDRIEVARWLIRIKSHSHNNITSEVRLTESLLCLWRYESLFHALLQLISECQSILPYSVKEVLLKIGDKEPEENQDDGTLEKFHLSNSFHSMHVLCSEEFLNDIKLKHMTTTDHKGDIFLSTDSLVSSEVKGNEADSSPFSASFESGLNSKIGNKVEESLLLESAEWEEKTVIKSLGNLDEHYNLDSLGSNDKDGENQVLFGESNVCEAEGGEEIDQMDKFGSPPNDECKKWSDENYYSLNSNENNNALQADSERLETDEVEKGVDEKDWENQPDNSKNSEEEQDQQQQNFEYNLDGEESFSNKNEKVGTDEASDLRPEERLVHLLCKLLIPNAKVFSECEGISGWHGRVCSMLSFCSSVSSYPVSFHALRIFNDFATVLFHCKLDGDKMRQFLLQLSKVVNVEDLENSLTSSDMFDKVLELYDGLDFERVSEVDFDCFVCMYIGRLIDINPETQLLGRFLIMAARLELPDKNLSHLGLLLHRVLLEVESADNSLFEVLKKTILDKDDNLLSYPQLHAMENALQEVDLKKPQFLILCADVIQDTVMTTVEWESLDDVKSAADDLLVLFKAAVASIGSLETGSLRLAAALAYVREFLHHLTEIIVYDYKNHSFTEHLMLYQSVNVLLNIDDSWKYLLRNLKGQRSFEEVKKLVTNIENLMPNLVKCSLPEDDLSLVLGYKILGKGTERRLDLEKSLLVLNSDDKLVCEYLKNTSNYKELLGLIEALLHRVFLPNAIRPLTDTEKQVGTRLKGHLSSQNQHQLLQALLQRITNIESFGSPVFRPTQEMTFSQLQQASFLLHLISIVVAKKSLNQNNLLTECLIRLYTIFKLNLHSLLTLYNKDKICLTDVNCSFVTCKCWSRVIYSEYCEECPVCGNKLATVGVIGEKFSKDDALPVAKKCFEVKALATEILSLFIDASLLCSLALGILDTEAIKAACELQDLSAGEDLIQSRFESSWDSLQNSLQLDPEDLALFLHRVIDNDDLFGGSFDFGNTENLQRKLLELEARLSKQFLTPSMYLDLRLYHGSISVISSEIHQSFFEMPAEDFEKLPSLKTGLFRQVRKRTLEDMQVQFYINEKEKDHPVVDLFFKKAHHLILLQHLVSLVKWSQLSYQVTNHCFTREDCRNLTLQKLISAMPSLREILKKCFGKFTESWEELYKEDNFALLKEFDVSLPAQRQSEQVMICENSDSVLYKVMKALVTIQNKFLAELLTTAQSGKCPSLGFLRKNYSKTAAIKSVLLQNLKEDQVINCDLESVKSDLVKYAQNNLIFGLGNQAHYNFVKIEMELANLLSLGKAYIVINDTFPYVSYANEMFIACASVLKEFKKIIPQKPLGQSAKDGITEKMKNNRDFINQMMRQTEILLCLAKKTGGSPEQTLKSYNQAWLKTLPGGFGEDNLMFEGEPLCLSHLVALYEFLENLQADAAIKSMNQEFRKPLPKSAEKELRDFIDTNHIDLASIDIAFRRFVMRYLSNFNPEKMDLDTPLIQWIAESSLWPSGVQENGELEINKDGGIPKSVKSEFPQKLNLEHTFHALTCISEILEERAKHRAKWYQNERQHVTGTAASSSAKPQQGRQRARAKIGKT